MISKKILILSLKIFSLIRNTLIKRDNNKKQEAGKGAENSKKIPILKLKYPIL